MTLKIYCERINLILDNDCFKSFTTKERYIHAPYKRGEIDNETVKTLLAHLMFRAYYVTIN